MTMAYDPTDPLKHPYSIEQWLHLKRNATPHCVICNDVLSKRNEHNDRTTHFLHRGGSGCPTVESSGASYAYLKKLPRSNGASAAVKKFVHDNVYGFFTRMRNWVEGLTWTEFLACCQQASKLGVWDLIDLPNDLAVYVLLTCGEFPKSSYRKRAVFFFLEPNPTPGGFWMFPKERKRILYKVDVKNSSLEAKEIDFTLPKGKIINDVLQSLT